MDLPPPSNLLHLQRLQGKANFLRRFIPNYAEMAKVFTHLLKKEIPFYWDQVTQASFDALKDTLVRASLMYSPNYQNDYYLYLATTDTIIGMVLVQEENDIEHPIYYLSRNLNDTEGKYYYVEKLALATMQAVQRFCHYILLQKTTVISDCNPMTYILSHLLLGRNIQNGQLFYRNLIQNSSSLSQRNLQFSLSYYVTFLRPPSNQHSNHQFCVSLCF